MVVPLSSTFSGLTVQFSDWPCYSRKSDNKGAKSHLLLRFFRKHQVHLRCLTFLVAVQLLMVVVFHTRISNNICILLLHRLRTSASLRTQQDPRPRNPDDVQVGEGTIIASALRTSNRSLTDGKRCSALRNAQFLCFLSHFMGRL